MRQTPNWVAAAPCLLATAAILLAAHPAFAGGGAGGDGNPISGTPGAGGAGGTGYTGQAGGDGGTNCINTNGGSGGGGGGGAGGGAGGNSGGEGTGCVVTSGGAGGTAGSPDGQNATTGGGGGGGGYNGNGAGTATLSNSGPLQGGNGGIGGTYPTAPQPRERSGSGGGGAGGYGAIVTGSGPSSNTGEVEGGDGGRGGYSNDAHAGDGGEGGIGVLITGDGAVFSNTTVGTPTALIRGGNGGLGGTAGTGNVSQTGDGGDGGAGGAGIVFAGSGGTLINGVSSTVQAGAGGLRGHGDQPGAYGPGGVGVQGANLTIINAGNIVGGLSLDGVRSDAVSFTGGVNRLELQAGSVIVGNVVASGTSDTLTLGGDSDASFLISRVGDDSSFQYQGFDHFEKIGDSVWTLTGTTTATTPWTLRDGILSVSADGQLGDVAGVLTFDGGMLRVTGTSFNSLGARPLIWGTGGGGFDIADAANTFTVTQQLAGPGGLTKAGIGSLVLDNANNTYAGDTAIEAGILSADGGGAIGDQSAVAISVDARLNVVAAETIGSLAGAGDVSLATLGAVLTTGGNNGDTVFGGAISYTGSPGFGQLVKAGSGTMTMTGDTTDPIEMTVGAGKLIVGVMGAGSFAGTIDVQSGATLGGTGPVGQVTVEAGGVHAPGNSIGTQFVNGPYLLQAGAILEVETAPGANNSDGVIVAGTVNLTDAVLRVLAENGNYAAATSYLIIDNDGADSVTGTFGQVATNLAFLTPTVSYAAGDGNDVVLTMTRNQVQFGSMAATPNQLAVANVLSTQTGSNPLVQAVVGQSAAGAQQAFDAMSGEIHATVGGLLVDQSWFVRDSILSRLLQANYGGNAGVAALASGGPTVAALGDTGRMGLGMGRDARSAPSQFSSLAFWTQGFGTWGEFDGDGNAASADRTIGGLVSGMDAGLGGGWRAGFATGYTQTSIGVGARNSSASIDSYNLGGYAGGRLGEFALRAGGVWTWHQIDTDRSIAFPGFFERVEASYNGNTGQVFGEVALPTVVGKSALEPFAGLAYVSVDTGDITETGGLAALSGSGGDEGVAYSTFGLRAATEMLLGSVIVTPHVSAAWQHAFGDVAAGASLAFASFDAGFTVSGVPIARDAALIEAGVMLKVADDATFGISYQGQIAGEVEDHGLSGRLDWRF